jgi:hypothetical protein
MNRIKEPPQDNSMLGQWARWGAAPYCEFKDDQARLRALIARDVRRVLIAGIVTIGGVSMPWSSWFGLFFS